MGRVDVYGVERHGSLLDVPGTYLHCLAWGHPWGPAPVVERPGWGSMVWECRAECHCGRIRVDTIDPKTGALLARNYAHGHGFEPGADVDRQTARLEYFRRSRAGDDVADLGAHARRRRRRKAGA